MPDEPQVTSDRLAEKLRRVDTLRRARQNGTAPPPRRDLNDNEDDDGD